MATTVQVANNRTGVKKRGPAVLRLERSDYEPDLKKPAVRRRITNSLEWLVRNYQSRERQIAVSVMAEYFGSFGNPMFNWLRSNLLKQTRDYHAAGGRAKSYIVNREGFVKLWGMVHKEREFNYFVEKARQLEPIFRPYLDKTEPLPLHQTKEWGRVYGPHQELEREVRAILLKGCWDYDIEVAMPTIVIQATGGFEKYPKWSKYLDNKKAYRQALADKYGITLGQAKKVFQLLFSRAKFNGSDYGIGSVLGIEKCRKAMRDSVLMGLYDEAADIWAAAANEDRLKPLSGTERFAYYERLEQKVMFTIYKALDGKVRFWPFHDGFTALDGVKVDVEVLEVAVEKELGVIIRLSEDQL